MPLGLGTPKWLDYGEPVADPMRPYTNTLIDPGHMHKMSASDILQKMRELEQQVEAQKRVNMSITPMQMIFMRLFRDAKEGHKVHPFEHMDAFVNEKVAVVFIVKNNKPVTIEDDVGLFPSDALITQLRLLIG